MTNEITKDGDVTKIGKGEKTQETQANNSCMANIFMLINFMFSFVTWKLICLYAYEDKNTDKLCTGQMEEELVCSMNSKHMLEEPKDLLQTEYWKIWMKGLFKMRTLPRFTLWVSVAILQKNSKKGAHGKDPMNSFKMGSLM